MALNHVYGTEYNYTVLVWAFGDHLGPFGAVFSPFCAHFVAQEEKIGEISCLILPLFCPKLSLKAPTINVCS